MNPYAMVGLSGERGDAESLRARLITWHDAMVTHERHLRQNPAARACDEECPHAEAMALWREATSILGARARELTFLRSRAMPTTADHRQSVER